MIPHVVLPKLAFILVLLVAAACRSDLPSNQEVDAGAVQPVAAEDFAAAPYDLAAPNLSVALPPDLQEISGLTVLVDGRLGAVQDEDGLLFVISVETGAVEDRRPFGGEGDYEGIERVDDRLFVLRSDGTLLAISDGSDGVVATETFPGPLTEDNDTEGLGYEEGQRRLLLAAKEEPGAGLDDQKKAIYAFDVERGELVSDPAFVLDIDELRDRFDLPRKFKPSALALHPVSGELYVLSSSQPGLVVLGSDGRIQHAWRLPKSAFEQPEGLAFLPDGTLFITSEGDDGPPMFYRFAYRAAR